VDPFFQEAASAVLPPGEARLFLRELPLELRELPVLELRDLVQVVLPLRLLDLLLRLVDVLADRAQALDRLLLVLPLRAQRVRLLAEVGELFLQALQTL